MPTECELCHEMYEKADDDPNDICPECWEVQAPLYTRRIEGANVVTYDEDGIIVTWHPVGELPRAKAA